MAVEVGRRKWIAGLVAGGALMLAPVFGLLGTVLGLIFSFHAVESADPSMKASQLAHGISTSMWSTAIGLAILPIGIVVFGVSLYGLLSKRSPEGG